MLTDDNKDLRLCVKLAKLIGLLGERLEQIAYKHRHDEPESRVFRELMEYGSAARWGLINVGDAVSAAEDWINPDRHKPTAKFSEYRGE